MAGVVRLDGAEPLTIALNQGGGFLRRNGQVLDALQGAECLLRGLGGGESVGGLWRLFLVRRNGWRGLIGRGDAELAQEFCVRVVSGGVGGEDAGHSAVVLRQAEFIAQALGLEVDVILPGLVLGGVECVGTGLYVVEGVLGAVVFGFCQAALLVVALERLIVFDGRP